MKNLLTQLWGEPETAALGAVRVFLDACDRYPRERAKLIRLAAAAHAALHRVEKEYFLDQPTPWEHP